MASGLQTLVAATTATTAIGNLLMVSPQNTVGYQPGFAPGLVGPPPPTLPPPILFHYEGEQAVQSDCEITDHFIEDNTAVQDQIALKPPIITTHGFIGELNDVPPAALAILQTAAQKLTAIGAYAPQLSVTALLAYQAAFYLYQTAANAANALVSGYASLANHFSGSSGQSVIGSDGLTSAANQNLQQTCFQQFYLYQQQRTLFTVQTPWAVFQNMAIWKLHPVQDADTSVITDFNVTFKMIRTAQTAGPASGASGGQLSAQGAGVINLGNSTPAAGAGIGSVASGMGITGVA